MEMEKNKQNRSKKFLVVVIAIISFIITNQVIFFLLQGSYEKTLMDRYQRKKEWCKLLNSVADSVIEGNGIDIKKIPHDQVQYHIYNDGDNIIFFYYLKGFLSTDNPYNVTITLSNNYHILSEDYGIELENIDEFKKSDEASVKKLSVVYSLLFFCVIFWVILFVRHLRKKKNK